MPLRLLVAGHLLGSILFYANLLAAWGLYLQARRQRDAGLVASVFRVIDAGDRWAVPASLGLVIPTGLGLASQLRIPLGSGWILWSVIALAASGLLFVIRVAPLQRRLARASDAEGATDLEPDVQDRQAARWARWAGASTILAFVPLVLMLFRP